MWCLFSNFTLVGSSLMSRPKYTRYIVNVQPKIVGSARGPGIIRGVLRTAHGGAGVTAECSHVPRFTDCLCGLHKGRHPAGVTPFVKPVYREAGAFLYQPVITPTR
jgi:hypothetical protein